MRGEVGETSRGVFEAEPLGEYCVDLRYACCWYGAWCCGMAVAAENWVAMSKYAADGCCDEVGGGLVVLAARLSYYTANNSGRR